MNKFGLISLSVLGTLGISAGAVAILNTAPNTKAKIENKILNASIYINLLANITVSSLGTLPKLL